MSGPRVLFYVQYLEGIGHVMRAKHIVEALAASGATVSLVLGGHPVRAFTAKGATLHQLPPLSASPESYSLLLTADGTPLDDQGKARRRDALLAVYATTAPDILITEAYPMGRWAMDFELIPLLEHAATRTPSPLILASLRDILQMPKHADKWQSSIRLFERYYDAMLVHGDKTLCTIEESFPPLAHLIGRAHYTGIVAPKPGPEPQPEPHLPSQQHTPPFDVIVSAGGGAIGHAVLSAAIAAKPLTTLSAARWLALTGPRMPKDEFDALATAATKAAIPLERYRPDLTNLLATARLSVQRAGYNTVADLLLSGCRAVLVPDAGAGQTEQPMRARKLESLGRAVVLPELDLSPATMAAAIDRAIRAPVPALTLDLDGAVASARIILDLWRANQRAHHPPKRR